MSPSFKVIVASMFLLAPDASCPELVKVTSQPPPEAAAMDGVPVQLLGAEATVGNEPYLPAGIETLSLSAEVAPFALATVPLTLSLLASLGKYAAVNPETARPALGAAAPKT